MLNQCYADLKNSKSHSNYASKEMGNLRVMNKLQSKPRSSISLVCERTEKRTVEMRTCRSEEIR